MGAYVALKPLYIPFSIDGAFPDVQAAHSIGWSGIHGFQKQLQI